MKRRTFLKASGLATASLMVPEFLKARENNISQTNNSKILIVIQLSGGNDGLNTVIPYENDLYYRARPQIAIKKNEVLKINNELGFHPSLSGFSKLINDGNLCIINNVGYPEPDRSHFRSMDIWHTASNSNEYKTTGWLGRYLDELCKNGENPTKVVELDDTLSLALKGSQTNGLAFKDPKKLLASTSNAFINQINKQHTLLEHQHDNASYLYKTLASTISSSEYIYQTSKIFKSNATYPNHEFGKSMKTIAELIISGVNTSVYYVSLGSFDTHFNQNKRQAELLSKLSDTISVFMSDMKKNGRLDDVLLMTFSEFGRRVQENGSMGTDHGTANQVFLIGNQLKHKGIVNDAPDLSDLDDGDLKFQVDFKNIYATILKKWLMSPSDIILGRNAALMDFI